MLALAACAPSDRRAESHLRAGAERAGARGRAGPADAASPLRQHRALCATGWTEASSSSPAASRRAALESDGLDLEAVTTRPRGASCPRSACSSSRPTAWVIGEPADAQRPARLGLSRPAAGQRAGPGRDLRPARHRLRPDLRHDRPHQPRVRRVHDRRRLRRAWRRRCWRRRPRRRTLPGWRWPGSGLPPHRRVRSGAVLYALVFGPLQRRSSQALLIATIGLAIALGEALRLLSGSRQRWLQPFFTQPSGGIRRARSSSIPVSSLLAVPGVGHDRRGDRWRCGGPPSAAPTAPAPTIRRRRRWSGVDVDAHHPLDLRHRQRAGGVAGFVIATHYGIVSFAMGACGASRR